MTHNGWWCCQTIFGTPDVARVTHLLEDVERLRVIDRRLYLPPSVVDRLWRSYQETGKCTRRHGQGRSRMKIPMQGRFLVLLSRRNHMSAAKTMEIDFSRATEVHLSDQIVRYKLHYDGTRARRPAQCTVLTAQHRAVRFNFSNMLANIRTGRFVTGGQYYTQMRANSVNQLMIDVLECGDPRKNVSLSVTLSKFTGPMEAHHDLDRDSLGWPYRPVGVS